MDRKGFSLASLLLLTAVVAVFLAAICTAWLPADKEPPDPRTLAPGPGRELSVIGAMGGMVLGLLVGLVIGAGQVRPLPGVCLGTCVGMITGAASGALLVMPRTALPVAVGSLVIILFGAVVRRCSSRPPKQ